MTQEARELVERLREACNGHPHAKIAWPHRVLHDAATTITTLLDKLAAEERAVDAFADICDELGCERDNEAGLLAAAFLKARADKLVAALDIPITDEELLRIRNGCEHVKGKIGIWAKLLQQLVDSHRAARSALADKGVANG